MLKHIMCKSVLVGVGLFSLITFGHAYGTTYYTAVTGSDSNSCSSATSQSTPKRTVTAGLACLSAGDTLYIRGGTYTEKFHTFLGTVWPTGTSWTTPVTIASYPGETATLRSSANDSIDIGDANYPSESFRQYIIFDRLIFDGSVMTDGTHRDTIKLDAGSRFIRIQNSKIVGNLNAIQVGVQYGADPAYPASQSTNNEFINNEIYNHSIYGIYMGGVNNLVDGNYIHDNGGYGIHLYSSGRRDQNDNIIRNNFVQNNGGLAVSTTPTCGIILASGVNNQAYNNVVVNHQAGHPGGGCGIQVYGSATDAKVYNNTLVGNAATCIDNNSGSSGAIIRNNICYNNGSDIVNNGSGATIDHNTTNAINPQFVNATSADFHLQSTSPAIDTGLIISIITMDIAKVSRPQGKDYDIGAYEYIGNQFPTPSNLRVMSTQQ